ncbi:MAG: hypothetical protein U0869_11055 [Chloroflexota bacterium]
MTSTTRRPGRGADELLAHWAEVAGRARRPTDAPTGSTGVSLAGVARVGGVVALALAGVFAVQGMSPHGTDTAAGIDASPTPMATPDGCPATPPNLAASGAWPSTRLDYGYGGLFTTVAPDGTIRIRPDEVGSTGLRWHTQLFHREPPTTEPIDAVVRPFVAHPQATPWPLPQPPMVEYPDGHGDDAILRVDIGFPTDGCWEVTLRSGTAELTFLTRVVTDAATPPSPAADPSAAP